VGGRTTGPIWVRHSCRSPSTKRDAPWQPNLAATPHLSTLAFCGPPRWPILCVSPKTVSRWAKEGKLPFLNTLGGHRRYPEAEIRDLAEELREEATT
jgi:excisionase family DNA binding protein